MDDPVIDRTPMVLPHHDPTDEVAVERGAGVDEPSKAIHSSIT